MRRTNKFFIKAEPSLHRLAKKGNDVRSVQKVLVVHQHRLLADSIVVFLTSQGYAARASYSASAAMTLLGLTPFDLIICSSSLLDLSGIQLENVLKNGLPHCKILILHPGGEEPSVIASRFPSSSRLGLVKSPVHPHALLVSIEEKLSF
jgi:DNA-binding response OmpR family regulator